jgi:hypothetical protein
MKRLVSVLSLALAVGVTIAASDGAARSTASLCVGSKPGCFSTIQAALDAATDGDVVAVDRGTFPGGVKVTKSVRLVGAGAGRTVISGGGPVVTIGVAGAASEPTVSIAGVTISDGVNASDPTFVVGGGILVPAGAGGDTGATVTIADSVISGNRATPTVAAPIGPPCPGGPCGFARGDGGGIANWGNLTLVRTTVSGNEAGGPVASDAHGGGIWSARVATLTLEDCAVTGNDSDVVAPNGRFAIGGGIHIQDGGGLQISNTVVSGNTASLSSSLPGGIDMISNGGGIHVGDGSNIAIDNTRIDGNTVLVDDPVGQPSGFDAGMIVGASTLALRNSTIDGNRVVANVAATDDNGPSGGAIELDGTGTIENAHITGNSTTVTSQAGNAAALGALQTFGQDVPSVVSNTVISDNTASASSSNGAASVRGAGVVNNGLLELRNVQVAGNSAETSGPTGFAQGGGIWNGALFNGPPIELTLENTNVARNTIRVSPGLSAQGAGLFSQFSVTLDKSRIDNNTPDDCVGC